MLLNIISFLIVFTIIALTHELGHLIWAKKAGVRVYELALGFGPRLISFVKNQTRYSINLIPILGYVKIAGEGENEEDKNCPEEEKFYNKSPIQKIKALSAGPGMNIFIAFIILSFIFLLIGIPKEISNEIGLVNRGSPAERAGLKVGDKLIAINGKRFNKMEEAITFIHQNPGKELLLTISRNHKQIVIKATPKFNERLKVGLLGFSPKPIYKKVNPIIAIYYGAEQTIAMILLTLVILGQLIIGKVSIAELAGPVGIAQVTGKYAQAGLTSFLYFTALISVNIGVLNLLPIPALDGGHIFFAILELLRKKRLDPKVENRINFWGLVILLTIMALVTLNDLARLFYGR